MNIKFISHDGLEDFKSNFNTYSKYYLEKDKASINELFEDKLIEGKVEYTFPNLEFDSDYINSDLINCKKVYESLKHLSLSQASQENLWVGLMNSEFLDYGLYRLNQTIERAKDTNNINNLFSALTFKQGKRRGQVVQNLSRLWWMGRYTYDETKTDPYELTDYFAKESFSSRLLLLSSRHLMTKDHVRLGYLDGLKEYETKYELPNKRVFTETPLKALYIQSGYRVLDILDRSEITDITYESLKKEFQ